MQANRPVLPDLRRRGRAHDHLGVPGAVDCPAVPAQACQRLPTPPAERTLRQVQGIDAWNADRRVREDLHPAGCDSRDYRQDASRRLDILRRTHQAFVSRTAKGLAASGEDLTRSRALTVIIAHRHARFVQNVTAALMAHGVTVLVSTDNGPDALGAVVAEQPDVVLVGDQLAMMTGDDLLAETRLFAPLTVRAVQVNGQQQPDVRAAEVDALFLPHHPPGDVADTIVALCRPSGANYQAEAPMARQRQYQP